MYLEINLEREALRDAFAKSDAVKPQVRAGQCTEASASYKVISSDSQTWYEVEFTRSMSGRPFGSCSCVAGHDGFYCYHLTAALYVHCGLVQHGLRPLDKSFHRFGKRYIHCFGGHKRNLLSEVKHSRMAKIVKK